MKVRNQWGNVILLLIITVFLLLPLVLTFLYSVFTQWTDILPTNFTLRYYIEILSDGHFITALLRSIAISFISVVICTITMLLIIYVLTFYNPKLEKWIEILCNIPYALQGIILAVGVISLYAGKPGILSNRLFLLIGAYCVMILPYMYRGIKNTIDAIHVKPIIEAAQVLGCQRKNAFLIAIIPQMKKGILSTMILAFTMLFADFALVNMIAGSAYQTASIYLYQTISKSGQLSSAIIVILFLFTLCISSFTLIFQDKEIKKGRN